MKDSEADRRALDRRQFIKVCAGAGVAVAANPGLMARPAGELRPGESVRLVDSEGRALRAADLAVGESYVFHYPYVTTPCFLIDLGERAEAGAELETADGRAYRWSGGVGPRGSIVAFSAICAHRMSYPTRAVSFIDYRHQPVSGGGDSPWGRGQVIYCCSEGSVYDPQNGARVLAGPASQPLAAVRLEYDGGDDALYATGMYGGDMLERFFATFGFQIALAHGSDDIRRPVAEVTTVWPMSEYSRTGAC
ncbi:twin-arginine translocation signal domain-containing protein [Lentisalinibacter salinarum]|uniref:twin-arginine translocation signal domain-containing protein n=1 Tax=Lentisalinibacter salinarum TaxID=2992239 RepID=UPI00386FF80E